MKTDTYHIGIWDSTIPLEEEQTTEQEHWTTPSPTMTYLNMAKRFQNFSHHMAEAFNTCNGNIHFTNQTYQETQTKDMHISTHHSE